MRRYLPLLALLLAGCSGAHVFNGPEAGAFARERAHEVARAWSGSAAQQAWQTGYYPLDQSEEWLPPGSFHSMDDKAAYLSGHLDVTAALPADGPGTAVVTWADGSSRTLPMVSAGQVLHRLTATGGHCGGHCTARLAVTAIRPGTRSVATSRGQATIPTWEFTIRGYEQPFAYPAVAGPQPPARPGEATPDLRGATSVSWTGLSADGRTLTGTVPCVAGDRVGPTEVYETADALVPIGHVAHPQQVSASVPRPASIAAKRVRVEFRLAHPLGKRAVLDLLTGAPETAAQPPAAGHPAESASC